jgi:CheY-like chemotaxis protein
MRVFPRVSSCRRPKDAFEGVELFHKTAYAAVLIGFHLPNMSGLELTRLLGAIAPTAPSFSSFDTAGTSSAGDPGSGYGGRGCNGSGRGGLCPLVLLGGRAGELTGTDRGLLARHYRDDAEVPFTGADLVECLADLFPSEH